MARAANYNRLHIRKILMEHDRSADTYRNYVDRSRSHLNYGYGSSDKSANQNYLRILSRCNEIMDGRKMQSQTNVICEWIVTYPSRLCTVEKYDTGKVYTKGLKKGEKIFREYNKPENMLHCRKFFDTVYKFCQDRYGADNVIAGYVHMDETTPQIHVCIVPESTSRKNGKITVSSASLLTRSELRNYHRDLQKEMTKVFGKDANDYILNGRTKGNYTIDELKHRNKDKETIISRAKKIKEKEAELSKREEAIKAREIALGISNDHTDDQSLRYRQQIILRNEEDEKEERQKELSKERYKEACLELNVSPTKTMQRSL